MAGEQESGSKKMGRLARSAETAKFFQVSEMTLWRWRKEPSFPKMIKKGHIVWYDIDAVSEWLRSSSL